MFLTYCLSSLSLLYPTIVTEDLTSKSPRSHIFLLGAFVSRTGKRLCELPKRVSLRHLPMARAVSATAIVLGPGSAQLQSLYHQPRRGVHFAVLTPFKRPIGSLASPLGEAHCAVLFEEGTEKLTFLRVERLYCEFEFGPGLDRLRR